MSGILTGKVIAGDVVVIRYEGPRGGPGMQEMLYPTSYIKSKGLGKACALVTDGRFSGGTSGLSIGHVSPEAAEGGLIALVQNGDRIEIDIPTRGPSASLCRTTELGSNAAPAQTAKGFRPVCAASSQGDARPPSLRRHDHIRRAGRRARREPGGAVGRWVAAHDHYPSDHGQRPQLHHRRGG